MKNQGKGNIGKYINLILLCLLFTFGSACEQKTDNDPTQTDGDGNGVFRFEEYSTIPTSFNCNTSGSFTFYLRPVIEDDWEEFNRLHFELEKYGEVYRSNYVEFSSADESVQLMEWGGSLPTGEYQMTGILENIQLNSTCADKICSYFQKSLGNIDITEFSNPQKVMYIEYDCQESDTSIISHYDVFLSPKTAEYTNIAFNIANTGYTIDFIADDYDPVLVEFTGSGMAEYIFDHKQFGEHMYLGGIKGFKDVGGNFIPYALGNTAQLDTITFTPSCSTGSLVAVKACINFSAPEYKLDYKDLVTATTIHELAHHRGVWGHHVWGSGPKFCRMKPTPWYPSGNNTHPHYAETYSNPHFCQTCINKIKNITW
jgi:hypothetical protein